MSREEEREEREKEEEEERGRERTRLPIFGDALLMCAFPRNCLESRSHQVTPQHTGRFLSAIVPTVRPSSCRLALEQFESLYVRTNAPIVHFFVWRWTQLGSSLPPLS